MIRVRAHRIVRTTASALALLVFASPVLATLHEASVRHVACPEHGELVEEAPQAPHQHGRAAWTSPALFAERDSAGPRSATEEHQHCVVTLQAQVRGHAQASKTWVPPASGAAVAAPMDREHLELRRLALYRLAPKASPPLV